MYRPFLDRARWVAAFVVAFGHALAILENPAKRNALIDYVAGLRGNAVLVFFLLSGYFVGGILLRDVAHFRWSRYCIDRWSRIYIVLTPALLFTAILDGLAFHYAPTSPVYSGPWLDGVLGDSALFSRYTLKHLLGSVLCLEPLFDLPLGSAGSLWSLGYEWIFYFAFPVVYLAGHKLGKSRGADAAILLSVAAIFHWSHVATAFWVVWLMGAYANRFRFGALPANARLESRLKAVICLGLLLPISESSLLHGVSMICIGGCGFIFLASPPSWEPAFVAARDTLIAGFSYSLYAIHLQWFTFSVAWLNWIGWLPDHGISSPWVVLGAASVLLASGVAVAWGFAGLFESRTRALARWLYGMVSTLGAHPADSISS
jgi:peptidoglycan/LPS O-acetylase OafA/YrhL